MMGRVARSPSETWGILEVSSRFSSHESKITGNVPKFPKFPRGCAAQEMLAVDTR
jgi:hypothetical protein